MVSKENLLKDYEERVRADVEQHPPGGLVSKDHLVEKKVGELNQALDSVKEIFDQGFAIVNEKYPLYLNAEEKKQFEIEVCVFIEAWTQAGEEGFPIDKDKTLQASLGLSDFVLYCIYRVGYGLYGAGYVEDAEKVLNTLIMLNPYVADFQISLGMINEKRGKWKEAQVFYAFAIEVDPEYPLSYLHFAATCLHFGEKADAEECCQRAEEIIRQHPEFDNLKEPLAALKRSAK